MSGSSGVRDRGSSNDRGGWVATLLLVGLWLLTVLEVLGMGAAGLSKFSGDGWPRMFEGWGFPAAFAYVIGAAEAGLAVLLLVPRLTGYAAVLLNVIMLGAMGTLLTTSYETQLGLGIPMVHIAVLTILARARWGRRWRPRLSAD